MNLYRIIVGLCSFFRSIWLYFVEPPRAEVPFKPKLKSQAQSYLARVNQRRLRKRQRAACRSGDRFAFA